MLRHAKRGHQHRFSFTVLQGGGACRARAYRFECSRQQITLNVERRTQAKEQFWGTEPGSVPAIICHIDEL